ncbi:MAG: GtrA family protein, partial [Bacteroidota bacterium]|nr:GtrA family protein [Bacteroidota bacterium]
MFTFIKSQASSLLASLVDFLVTIFAVELLGWQYVPGSVAGTISGGLVNFTINRIWVFGTTSKAIPAQAFKYLVVWLGNLVLNATGV